MKKVLSIVLSLVMLLSMSVTAFAAETTTTEKDTFCIDNYTQYTISFSGTKASTNARSANENTIDAAISYVESLELEDMGYAHIEEACLNELNAYKNDDVILESYTVLVPKTRVKYYYGTYLNHDYYYEYTSVSDMRRETDGAEKQASNESQWNSWILGAMDLAMCFSTARWSVPYTLVRTITGVSGTSAVHYGSYNQYVEQFTNTVTRTIFKERSSTNLDPCYQDQTSSLRVKLYFCPVGTAFDSDYIEIDTVYNGSVKANNLTKEEILRSANVYSNHNAEIIYRVSYHRVTEEWGS